MAKFKEKLLSLLARDAFVRSQGIRPGTSHCFTVLTTSQPLRSIVTHWTDADTRRTSLISGD